MTPRRYVVQKGDCLWDLAERFLGSPWQWRRIHDYNKRSDIVRLTGRIIDNPDLIYPGQILYLPIMPGQLKPPHRRDRQPRSLNDQIPRTFVPFAMAYRLDDLPLMI